MTVVFSNSIVEDNDRLRKLRHELRKEHLNEERVSLIKICEEYNGVFHLPPDNLTFTTAAEHPHPNSRPHAGNKYKTLQNS
jgi:hypothetical protein